MKIEEEINSKEYQVQINRLIEMRKSIAYCVQFCHLNSLRDGLSGEKNFFLRMLDDILQSVISIEVIAKEGIRNTCRRELRYLIEVAIKSCLIVQKNTTDKFESQVDEYEKLLNSSNINPINAIQFNFFNEIEKSEFLTYTKRLYGYLSKYTHSTSHQILERLMMVNEGRTIGFEGTQEIKELNNDIEKAFSIVIVLLFNSVAQYVVGDFLVASNGDINEWYFSRSKFVSIIDTTLDYKFERKAIIEKVKQKRSSFEYF